MKEFRRSSKLLNPNRESSINKRCGSDRDKSMYRSKKFWNASKLNIEKERVEALGLSFQKLSVLLSLWDLDHQVFLISLVLSQAPIRRVNQNFKPKSVAIESRQSSNGRPRVRKSLRIPSFATNLTSEPPLEHSLGLLTGAILKSSMKLM